MDPLPQFQEANGHGRGGDAGGRVRGCEEEVWSVEDEEDFSGRGFPGRKLGDFSNGAGEDLLEVFEGWGSEAVEALRLGWEVGGVCGQGGYMLCLIARRCWRWMARWDGRRAWWNTPAGSDW